MSKNKPKNKIIISVIAVVVAAAIALGIFLPRKVNKKISINSYIKDKQSFIEYSKPYDINLTTDNGSVFTIDSKTTAAAFLSPSKKAIYNAFSEDSANLSLASILNIRLRDRSGNSYTMNSTDNSVEFGTFEVLKQNKDKCSVIFNFFPDKKSADKGNVGSSVFATITVAFSVEKGNLRVSVNMDDVVLPKDFYLEKISILPGLFTNRTDFADSYYTVPDGPGAIVNLNMLTEKPITMDLAMYGSDVTFYDYNPGANLPYFAYTKEDCLLNTIIASGDALSEITCKKFSEGGGYLYNTFTVTACGFVDDKLFMGESYKGEISQEYIMKEFQDSEITYNDIASQVRDSLIYRGYLPAEPKTSYEDIPVFIEAIASDNGKDIYSNFEDIGEIAALLKSKGVQSTVVRYLGAQKKGLSSAASSIVDFSKSLGDISGFDNLQKIILQQGNKLYLEINPMLQRVSSKGIKAYGTEYRYFHSDSDLFKLATGEQFNKNLSKAFKFSAKLDNLNFALNDASYLLFTDKDGLNRQSYLDLVRKHSGSLAVNGDLMLTNPAIYLIKQADSVFSLPEKTSYSEEIAVKSVPILQMVLHGSVVYGTMPINLGSDSAEDALLKCAEFGCAPTFMFTHSGNDFLNYGAYVNQISKMNSRLKKLKPILNMTMTSHEQVVPGVYKVTYDFTKVVYVNYNPSVVDVNGLMIAEKDFIIV